MVMFWHVLGADFGISVLANAISVGFVLIVLIEMFRPISGAHFNPIVTIVMRMDRKIEAGKAIVFVLLQFLGGLLGAVFSHLMFYDTLRAVLGFHLHKRSVYTYFGELFGAFILILAILMLTQAKSRKISFFIGLLVGGQLLATSSNMFANPQVTFARMFSPTISGIHPVDALAFIAMQIIGAVLAYTIFKRFFLKKEQNEFT